jgi:hypothetical protein
MAATNTQCSCSCSPGIQVQLQTQILHAHLACLQLRNCLPFWSSDTGNSYRILCLSAKVTERAIEIGATRLCYVRA